MNTSAPSTSKSGVVGIGDDVFSSEETVLAALVAIRNSALPPQEKSALRDLFLDFAGESDQDRRQIVRETIERRLARNQLEVPTAVSIKNSPTDEPKPQNTGPALGIARPQPSFATEALERFTAGSAKSAVVPEQKEVAAEAVKVPIKINPSPVEPVKNEDQPSAAQNIGEVPRTSPNPAPTTPQSFPGTRARIDEIKHTVNKRVGNPVNLINLNPTIGKAYMSALLDAMKRGSGGELEAKEALDKLESVFLEVQELLDRSPKGGEQEATKTAAPTPEESVAQKNNSESPTKSAEAAVLPTPKTPPPPLPKTTKQEGLYHRPIDAEATVQKKTPIISVLANRMREVKKTAPTNGETNKAVASNVLAKNIPPTVRKVNVTSSDVADPTAETRPTTSSDQGLRPLSSVSNATSLPEQFAQLKQLAAEQEQRDKEVITDLMAEKVTAGLKQLLSEWEIFKGSGWFGRGASGSEHPLYKQLQDLPMAAVIAGRFEGVNPNIRQSLTDYMNGWRYEQGIVHDMGETFEHYLRRVILHILERQHDPMKPQKKS